MKGWIAIGVVAIAVAGCSSQESSSGETAEGDRPVLTASVPKDEMASASPGKKVFYRWCVECHGDGPRYPGTASLAVKYGKDMPAPLEQRKDLTPESVALFVRQGVSVMPPFRKTEITDAELAALGAYLSHNEEAVAPSAK